MRLEFNGFIGCTPEAKPPHHGMHVHQHLEHCNILADAVPRPHGERNIRESVPLPGIGENIAMFEMLVHMHTMVRRFRLRRATNEPIELEAQINLRPRSNLMMMVETR